MLPQHLRSLAHESVLALPPAFGPLDLDASQQDRRGNESLGVLAQREEQLQMERFFDIPGTSIENHGYYGSMSRFLSDHSGIEDRLQAPLRERGNRRRLMTRCRYVVPDLPTSGCRYQGQGGCRFRLLKVLE